MTPSGKPKYDSIYWNPISDFRLQKYIKFDIYHTLYQKNG